VRALQLDQYILHRAHALEQTVLQAYDDAAYLRVHQALLVFCTQHLSAFYLEIVKDRLYLDAVTGLSRRSAQTTLALLLRTLSSALAPIACHLSEELHGFAAGVDPAMQVCDSVVRAGWQHADPRWHRPDLDATWDVVRAARRAVFRGVQESREQTTVGGAANAAVMLTVPRRLAGVLLPLQAPDAVLGGATPLEAVLMVSRLTLVIAEESYIPKDVGAATADVDEATATVDEFDVVVAKTDLHKCPRCWRHMSAAPEQLCGRCHSVVGGGD